MRDGIGADLCVNQVRVTVADPGLSGGGFVLLPKKSDDFFSCHTLDAYPYIHFKLNYSKPVSTLYYPNLPFMSP